MGRDGFDSELNVRMSEMVSGIGAVFARLANVVPPPDL